MPSRNALKVYVENGVYHVYNRGINKDPIFLDKFDYGFFLSLLRDLLSSSPIEKGTVPFSKQRYFGEIELISFCLMPNHFHLVIRQKGATSMSSFVKSLSNNYSNYFNKKYDRCGPMFQGRYKAVLVDNDEYLSQLVRYVHRNPLELRQITEKGTVPFSGLGSYEFSSYIDYIGKRRLNFLAHEAIVDLFGFNYVSLFQEDESIEPLLQIEKYSIDS